jgi:hypothetical protein
MRRLIPVWFAVALTLLAGSTDAWAKADVSPVNRPADSAPASSTEASSTAAERPSLDQTYRARETKAAALETFEGGDVVVIGGTTLVVVLLVILIIVLI